MYLPLGWMLAIFVGGGWLTGGFSKTLVFVVGYNLELLNIFLTFSLL
jgi:hypothetical protein